MAKKERTSKGSLQLAKATAGLADEAVKIRAQVIAMRKPMLANIREIVRSNQAIFEKAAKKDNEIAWMVGKIRRGYFGTDIRTESLPKLLEHIIAVLNKN